MFKCQFLMPLAMILGLSACVARAEAMFVPMIEGKVAILPFPPPPDNREIGPPRNPGIRPVPQPHLLPFRVTSSKVDVRIDENIATTTWEQTFLNLAGRDLEVRVMIPLPPGATINSSALSMDNQMIEGKLYDAQQARSIYESIVSQRRDPALLRFAGENLYEARVFPIPPNQERRLRFSYSQVLASNGGLYDYRHILAGSQMYKDGIEKFEFTCTVKSSERLGPIYSPSHQVSVERPDPKTAVVKLSGANMSSSADFHLYYAPTTEDVSLRMIAHRNSDNEDGYFMLIGRVDDQLHTAKVLQKEIVFVMDTSGSMQGDKIEQAKRALKFCVNSLNPSDRFNIITFSTDVQGLSSSNLLEASKENIEKALKAIDQIEATGGTNIDGALRAALGSDFTDGSAKAKTVVFMTDGLPTVGVTDGSAILTGVNSSNAKKVRIFNFGVGNDVNTHLLDRISTQHDGFSTYVTPREDMEVKVSDFASKIKHPVMTDVSLDFASANVNSVYPRRIPALYRGGEITIFGRYKGNGPQMVTLTGNVGGEVRKITMNATFPARDISNSYLPRVWAMRKIGYLLEEVRLAGQNQELIKEIVELAQRHGIVTPYTSQLVLEPGMNVPQGGGGGFTAENRPMPRAPMKADEALRSDRELRRNAQDAAKKASALSGQTFKGEGANAVAMMERDLKEAASEATPMFDAQMDRGSRKRAEEKSKQRAAAFGLTAGKDGNGAAIDRAAQENIRQAGSRTFYNRGGVWVDAEVNDDAKPTVVKAFSKEYFDLMKDDATLGSALALGGKILVMVKGTLYQIDE